MTFFTGTIGFPINITLLNFTSADLAAITAIDLKILRPNGTNFDNTLNPATALVGSVITYTTVAGDLSVSGTYHFVLTLTMSGPPTRTLPLAGTFVVSDTAFIVS